MSASTRAYHQVARAAAAEDTRRRIVAAFTDALRTRWMDEITLDGVAAAAGTTRQTVIRLFGGKEGLLGAVGAGLSGEVARRRALADGAGAEQCIRVLVQDYEVLGDLVIRLLAQEGRYPVLSVLLDVGRRGHRAWVSRAFAPALRAVGEAEQNRVVDQLVVATDVYAWKLLRRDVGHSAADTEAVMAGLVGKLLQAGEK